MSERGDRDLPEVGKSEGESDGDDGEETGLAVADVHPRTDRPRRRATRGLRRDNSRLLGDVTPVLPSSTGEKRASPNPRHPRTEELIPGGRLVVGFHDDPGWDHSRLFLWPIDASTWISLLSDGDKYAENFVIIQKCARLPSVTTGHPRLILSSSVSIGPKMS